MSKIKTENCVAVLVGMMPTTKASDWKRRSKKVRGEAITRVFENTKTHELWNVDECMDRILGVYQVKELKPVESLVKPIYYVLHEAEGSLGLTVTDSKEFDTRNRASDWTPEGTYEELDRLGYPASELAEGMLEFHNEVKDIEDLKAKLAASPVFKFSQAFQDFMLQYSNEEMKVIPI